MRELDLAVRELGLAWCLKELAKLLLLFAALIAGLILLSAVA